jgi:anti-anti-sigma factor
MDSSGLGAIAGLYVSAKAAGCRIELINLSQRIRELMSLTNILLLFESVGEHNIRLG